MTKPFLLIAGDYYYPGADTEDWVGCYSSLEDALERVETLETHSYFSKGKNKGEIKSTTTSYKIKDGGERGYDRTCDWYTIVDLRDWTR